MAVLNDSRPVLAIRTQSATSQPSRHLILICVAIVIAAIVAQVIAEQRPRVVKPKSDPYRVDNCLAIANTSNKKPAWTRLNNGHFGCTMVSK